jgi:hypothetical protein
MPVTREAVGLRPVAAVTSAPAVFPQKAAFGSLPNDRTLRLRGESTWYLIAACRSLLQVSIDDIDEFFCGFCLF